jgi:hypothetical protein
MLCKLTSSEGDDKHYYCYIPDPDDEIDEVVRAWDRRNIIFQDKNSAVIKKINEYLTSREKEIWKDNLDLLINDNDLPALIMEDVD